MVLLFQALCLRAQLGTGLSEKLILAKVLTAEWVVHVLSNGDFQSLRTWGRMERPETQVCLQALFGPAPRSLPASPGGLCGQQWAAPDTGLRLWSLTGAVSWIDKIPTICQMTSPGVAASGLPSKSWGAGGLCTLLLLLGPGSPPWVFHIPGPWTGMRPSRPPPPALLGANKPSQGQLTPGP